MNEHDPLDRELHRVGAELRSRPSLADGVVREIASSGDASLATAGRRANRSFALRRPPLPSLAALAGVAALIAVCVWIGVTRESSALAFEEVAARTAATQSVRADAISSRDGQINDRGKVYSSGTKVRFESEKWISVADAETGRSIDLHVARKEAYRVPLGAKSQLVDLYRLVRKLADAATTPIEDHVDAEGRRYPGYRGEIALDGEAAGIKLLAKVWSDPETKLPYRLEMRGDDSDDVLTLESIAFDVPLDAKLFDMTLPEGFAFVGPAKNELRPPLSKERSAKLTLVPHVGLGEARFGMTRDEVVAIFGEPETVQFDVYLGYPSQGFQLVMAGPGETFGFVIANPMDAASLTRHEFPGQTDKGIRIGSTEQDVRTAYGAPDPQSAEVRPPSAMLRYDSLGLAFVCMQGKVVQIQVAQTERP